MSQSIINNNSLLINHDLFISFMKRLSSFLNSFSIVRTDLCKESTTLLIALSGRLSEDAPNLSWKSIFLLMSSILMKAKRSTIRAATTMATIQVNMVSLSSRSRTALETQV